MNSIYKMQVSNTDTTPLVSNINVTDIRDDINSAITLCSLDDQGIAYEQISKKQSTGNTEIDHFDLILYPFKRVLNQNAVSENNYNDSFKLDTTAIHGIKNQLEDFKTVAHKIDGPRNNGDIAAIMLYLKLQAYITTTKKVNPIQEELILANIRSAIYRQFNMRNIDFGEQIPFDSILSFPETP